MLQQEVHRKIVAQQYRDARGRFAKNPNPYRDVFIPAPKVKARPLPVEPPKIEDKTEEYKEEARKFLLSITHAPRVCAFITLGGRKGTHRATTAPCHAAFIEGRDQFSAIKVAGSYIRDNTEEARAFNDYFFSEDSPWSAISTRCEIVKNNKGDRIGYIIPPEVFRESPQYFIYNFVIASRITVEFPRNVHTWYELRKLGLSSAEAHLFCRLLTFDRGAWQNNDYGVIDGWHWPFNHSHTNIKSFLNKKINPGAYNDYEPSCRTWSTGGSSGLPVSIRNMGFKQKEEGTKFSKVYSYDLKEVADWYLARKERLLG